MWGDFVDCVSCRVRFRCPSKAEPNSLACILTLTTYGQREESPYQTPGTPKFCPICGKPVRVIGTERFCDNVQCVNKYIPMGGDTENYE